MCTPDWLALREAADAAARAVELVEPLRELPGALVVRDLGCGTGAMGRWLAGRLPGPQHWILHDRDPALIARAVASLPAVAADGTVVRTRGQRGDVTALRAADLAATTLVTASALLDLLTEEEVDRLAAACVEAGCAALLTLTVTGDVRLVPADPLDGEFGAAFDAHQRRSTGGRRLLGPDAGAAAVAALRRRGAVVTQRPSPWLLGPHQAALAEEWLRGWLGAACGQRPDLRRAARAYLRRRLDACHDGALRVTVGHLDLLAVPAQAGAGAAA